MIREIKLGGTTQHIKILSADYSKYNAEQLFNLSGNPRRYVNEGGVWRFFNQEELENEKQNREAERELQQRRELFSMAQKLHERGLLPEADKDRIKSELGI